MEIRFRRLRSYWVNASDYLGSALPLNAAKIIFKTVDNELQLMRTTKSISNAVYTAQCRVYSRGTGNENKNTEQERTVSKGLAYKA